jgi:hypothetical protein
MLGSFAPPPAWKKGGETGFDSGRKASPGNFIKNKPTLLLRNNLS